MILALPRRVRVYPCSFLEGTVQPPSSKNYTARYLLAALLGDGESIIEYPAVSDDANVMRRACVALGATIMEEGDRLRVQGVGGKLRNPERLDAGNAGAVLRLLLAVCSVLPEISFSTPFPDSLGKRPHDDLLAALEQLGVRVSSRNGLLPITLRGGNLHGGTITVSGALSSQYLSGLLFLAPLVGETITIRVMNGLKSKPPVRTTLSVLRQAGISVEADETLERFRIPGGQRYQPATYVVPGDYPAAAALLAAAAVVGTGSQGVHVPRLLEDEQGERAIIPVLQQMGAPLSYDGYTAAMRGHSPLHGITFDGDLATDAVLAMVAAACFAQGESRFYNIENLRYKECDRITDFCTELRKAGASVEEQHDAIIVSGQPAGIAGGTTINAHHDHRVIMALTICGLCCRQSLIINDAFEVAKSYPNFFADMQVLGVRIEVLE